MKNTAKIIKTAWQKANTAFSASDPMGLGYVLRNNDPVPEGITAIKYQGMMSDKKSKTVDLWFTVEREGKKNSYWSVGLDELKRQYPRYRNDALRDDMLSDAIKVAYASLRERYEQLNDMGFTAIRELEVLTSNFSLQKQLWDIPDSDDKDKIAESPELSGGMFSRRQP